MLKDNRTTRAGLHLQGEVTIYRAGDVAQSLFAALRDQSDEVSLDLSEVSEFDTAGLQILLMARQMAEAAGQRFAVVNPSECVADVLRLCNLDFSAASAKAEA